MPNSGTGYDRDARVQERIDEVIETGSMTQFIEILPYLVARLAPTAAPTKDKDGRPVTGVGTTVHYLVAKDGGLTEVDPAEVLP